MTSYILSLVTVVGIQALLALGLAFQFGLTGVVNVGTVAFYAIGAYSSALLLQAGFNPFTAMLAGIAISIPTATILGMATLRLREDYFAVLTLAFAEVVRALLTNMSSITNGTTGISGIRSILGPSLGISPQVQILLLSVLAFLIALALCLVLARSPLGRTLRAIRDDETAAMALGKNPLHFRIIALIWGSVLASIAGSLWAHYVSFVVPAQFTAEVTFHTWMAMMMGGMGSMAGSAIGAAVMVAILEGSRFVGGVGDLLSATQFASVRQIFVGACLIALVAYHNRRQARKAQR